MLTINTAINPVQTKPATSKQSIAPKTLPGKQTGNAGLLVPKIENLSSKYNINFKGNRCTDLEAFSTKFEEKIEKMLTPIDAGINQKIPNNEDIDTINQMFDKDNIGNIYYTDVSLNGMLDYLSKKEQIQLKGDKTAFMLDDMSIEFLKSTDIENFLKDFDKQEIQFYYLGKNDEQFEQLADKFKDITGIKEPKIKIIEKQANPKSANYPNANEIKNILQALAKTKFNDKQSQEKFLNIASKYLDENFIAFSYQTLSEKLKEHYDTIQEYVQSTGKTMDDVVYMLPATGKSYDLINYLYAKTNNIPQEQFTSLYDARSNYSDEKIYVVLDDICASGASATEIIAMFSHANTEARINLVLAPLIQSDSAEDKINRETDSRKEYMDITCIPSLNYHDLGAIGLLESLAKRFKVDASEALKDYLDNFKTINKEEMDFLRKNTIGGFGDMHALCCFPYMIPDNSSEINTVLGSYFLNKNSIQANKGINPGKGYAGERITEEEFNNIMQLAAKSAENS